MSKVLGYTTVHYITEHSWHHKCSCNYTTLITLHHNYDSTTLQLQLELHYTTLHPAVVGEVTEQDHCNHCNHSQKHNFNHLSVHQWICSAIRDSQQPSSPICIYIYIYLFNIIYIPASSKVGLISAFCPINRFFTRTTFLGKPEFLLIYCCQARFSAAKMPDQTAKIPDQTAKIPDHVGWQFLTTAFIFQERRFSARTATILLFLSNRRNKHHMEDPGIYIYIQVSYSETSATALCGTTGKILIRYNIRNWTNQTNMKHCKATKGYQRHVWLGWESEWLGHLSMPWASTPPHKNHFQSLSQRENPTGAQQLESNDSTDRTPLVTVGVET